MRNKEELFDSADYYDAMDSEIFNCTTPEEAIEQVFEYHYDPDKSVEEIIDKIGSIKVNAFRLKKIPLDWAKNTAQSLGEDLIYELDSEYAHPDCGDLLNLQEEETFIKMLQSALEFLVEKAEVSMCEMVASKEYSKEEIFKIIKYNEYE